jgi:hypothetical protein
MNTTPQLDSNLLVDTDPIQRSTADRPAVTNLQYQQSQAVTEPTNLAVSTKKTLPQLTTFRALGRQVFGPAAGREYLSEAILFVWMMVVAAWPLGVTLNQLGTMYISPPAGGLW